MPNRNHRNYCIGIAAKLNQGMELHQQGKIGRCGALL